MRIPEGPSGFPTLYNSRLRAYGAAGFLMEFQESEAGCPRLYRAKYVDDEPLPHTDSYPLLYGQVIHAALHKMEEDAVGPDEALEAVWNPVLDMDAWAEAHADLNEYLERGGPMTRYGTIATEVELTAPLYDDPEFGPIWYAARLDWLGIDTEQPEILHAVDYKTNRTPPPRDAVQSDVQLKGQDWVVRQNWDRIMGGVGQPRVVMHLDAIKWYDVDHVFTIGELEEWQEWASAIARRILRDTKGEPKVNPGCGWCPVKHDCPAYGALPEQGVTLLEKRTRTKNLAEMYAWREEAAEVVKNLKSAIDEIDGAVKETVQTTGEFAVPGRIWELDVAYSNEVDLRALLDVVGLEAFLQLVGTSKTKILKWARRTENEDLILAVERCIVRQASGTTVKSRKVKVDGDAVG